MTDGRWAVMDGNEAAAQVAYRLSEVVVLYPITPSSPMGEWADAWAAAGSPHLWGGVPVVQEMQSEAGAAGALHGALQAGALATTFTSSQGLLLMLPEMYKMAGELLPAVIHVAARAVAAHALSIFGDHSDVMAARVTGFALLCSSSVQEAMDMAVVAHAAASRGRVPFLHFFDGFRTSHEIAKIEPVSNLVLRSMMDDDHVRAHRERALSPDHPVLRGTSQNPDVFFQSREAVNPYYMACASRLQRALDQFGRLTGRAYDLFEYHGAPDADRVLVLMGSGAETARETVDALMSRGEKVGLVKVRLYRPFSAAHFLKSLPRTVRTLAVLDRCKEPGAGGEPLYMDVVGALAEARNDGVFDSAPRVIGGRYGLSSKEFTPAMVKAVFDEAARERPKNHFTVGIVDDVTETSLPWDPAFSTESSEGSRAVFYGLGADGTVSANKSTIKILGELTPNHVQGYFVYDSKKSGAVTVSHLRMGPAPIRSAYLIGQAPFVACHQFGLLDKMPVLEKLAPGGTFLLNSPHGPKEVWGRLPPAVQEQLAAKKARFFAVDAHRVAREAGLKGRINTVMQACFFAVSDFVPVERAVAAMREQIHKSYGKKGEEVLRMNFAAVDRALEGLREVEVPSQASAAPPASASAAEPAYVQRFLGPLLAGRGDELPVSAFPSDGTFPTGTAKWEKRNIAQDLPVWEPDLCLQCGKCVMACPHSALRAKVYDPAGAQGAPVGFRAAPAKNRAWKDLSYTLQTAPEDCTGCGVCADVCPAHDKAEPGRKALRMEPQAPLRDAAKRHWEFFLDVRGLDRADVPRNEVRGVQLLEPLFEFPGACAGCGETPYLKLLSQLFGDRALIANATGCSSIYGGNLPTTPWTRDAAGRGPAWCNSLFEDNAEFGLGLRLAVDQHRRAAEDLLKKLAPRLGEAEVGALLGGPQREDRDLAEQRRRVQALKEKLKGLDVPEARLLSERADYLVKKSVWVVGGDGWAYDIGFGGLDHLLASGLDVNVLVMDTEVYSNTGGQMSKATPRGAAAKFATGGKTLPKKDLARMAMTYGHAYVAQVALGARDDHALRVFLEAEAYPGPSLIIAYSPCIAHGTDMTTAIRGAKDAVASGHWLLFRYNPALAADGKNPFQLDCPRPKMPLKDFLSRENRFRGMAKDGAEEARQLLDLAQKDVWERWAFYERLAAAPRDVPAEPVSVKN